MRRARHLDGAAVAVRGRPGRRRDRPFGRTTRTGPGRWCSPNAASSGSRRGWATAGSATVSSSGAVTSAGVDCAVRRPAHGFVSLSIRSTSSTKAFAAWSSMLTAPILPVRRPAPRSERAEFPGDTRRQPWEPPDRDRRSTKAGAQAPATRLVVRGGSLSTVDPCAQRRPELKPRRHPLE